MSKQPMKKPVNTSVTVPEGNNTTLDTDNFAKGKKPVIVPVAAAFAKPPVKKGPVVAPVQDAAKKPFPGAVKPFTSTEGENPPPMAKKPGKQDNNISAKIPMAPAGAYPNQLPSKPMRDPKKPPVPVVNASSPNGTPPNMNDDQNKKKGNKKK